MVLNLKRVMSWRMIDDLSEVGPTHSSNEACESRQSKGVGKQSFSQRKHTRHKEAEKSMGINDAEIRRQSAVYKKVQNLMRYVDEYSLKEEHWKQKRKKATGVDGVDKAAYDEQVDENIRILVEKMKKFQYKPLPVRRTYIPKANGKLRPLGIPAYEDRLVQGTMARLLNDVYEERFLDSSYGFRPGRDAHQVVEYINRSIMAGKVGYVLEADIKGFFDNVNHEWLLRFLEHDIQDKNFLRYIKRFLIAGIMEGTELKESDRGTPQGGLISPVLANVYLHYVLDLWFEKAIKPRLKGEAYYVRYADDFLIMFQKDTDAKAVMAVLPKRMGKFELELAEEKTRVLPFGRYKGTKESFDFLGFTFFNAKMRNGKYKLGVRTSKKKLKAKKQAAKAWVKARKNKPINDTMMLIAAILRGHYNYYGVSGNYASLNNFYRHMEYLVFKMLNRRSQRKSVTYEKFRRIWQYNAPKPQITVDICHWKPKTA